MRRAVIDIGTNSVKVLVGDLDPLSGEVQPVFERGTQTRLGSGFYQDHTLQEQPVRDTATACTGYVVAARELGAGSVQIIATSAARDARNPELLLDAVRKATGIPVQILTGEEEAGFAFRGVASDPRLAGRPLAILDVGGGSTELIAGGKGRIDFQKSFQLGTVRLLEQFSPGDPPSGSVKGQCEEWLRAFIQDGPRSELLKALGEVPPGTEWVGTGGTSVLLVRMFLEQDTFDRDLIESRPVMAGELQDLRERLWGMTMEQRRNIPGLPANRADVILFGVSIFSAILKVFGGRELRISTRGLRFGVLAGLGKP